MNNQSIGIGNNETFFLNKESMISDNCTILTDGNTKISDVSREFRELDGEIYKTIQKSGDVSGCSNNNNTNNNNTNNSIGILLDETWANQKGSPDTSLNFQRKLNEFKKKEKTNSGKNFNQKHTITLINNPLKGGSQFKIKNTRENLNEVNPNYTQTLNKNGNALGNNYEEEEMVPTDDIPNTTEYINKLHINSVKTNNLRELNSMYRNYNQYNTINNNSNFNEYFEGNDEFNNDNMGVQDLSYKTLNPKFMERNINASTRFSTNESNESFDSSNYNKFNTYEEKYSYNTPNFKRNHIITPMMQFPQGKKINFGNFATNPIYNKPNGFNPSNGGINVFPSNNENPIFYNNNNVNFNNYQHVQNLKHMNLQNLPENAFSFNMDNPVNNKSLSEKKKKKSKDEVDQTLFIINTENIIYGRDKRTTVMIRHIPNKYSTQSLLEEINTNFKGKYDFFYLPMDFENQCNLGYAFINFVDPMHILMFYEVFKARKWKKYKSHKECDLSYAKFQGKVELTSHLEKSCVMNKMGDDKKPVIITPPDPLPKIEVPPAYSEVYKSLYPHLVNKSIFLK